MTDAIPIYAPLMIAFTAVRLSPLHDHRALDHWMRLSSSRDRPSWHWQLAGTMVLLLFFVLAFQPGSHSMSTITAGLQRMAISNIEEEGKLLLVQVVHR